MSFFNWNTIIPNLPTAWEQSEGKGVKIAFLDSGANLDTPTLAHLNQPGHLFDVTTPGFNIAQAISNGGNDKVTDQQSFGEFHGTACLSVLAGLPESPGNGVKGVAPQAEVFIFKIMDNNAMYRKGYILDAIEVALGKDVDIIACSVLPSFNGTYTDGRRDQIFAKLQQKKVALITTVLNTTLLNDLVSMRFPSNHSYSIATGVVQIPILTPKPASNVLLKDISFLTTPVSVGSFKYNASDPFPMSPCSSSMATAALAGVCALAMASTQQRPDRNTLIATLKNAFKAPYDPTKMIGQAVPNFFSKA